MYAPLIIDEERYRVKPMNCPAHIKIFQTRARSYRDLPIRYAEMGTVYRYELERRAARHDARARLHPGRRPHLLHARSSSPTRSRACSTWWTR